MKFNNMKMELPELSRCCYCIPLLYGLMAWGYVKLILGGLGILVLTPMVIFNTERLIYDIMSPDETDILTFGLLVFVILDFISSIMLLAGAHTKSVHILRSYKIYNKILLGLFLFKFITDITFWFTYYKYFVRHYDYWAIIAVKFTGGFLYTVLQNYIIRLARSEIIELENNNEDTYESNAKANEVMAKCTLDMVN